MASVKNVSAYAQFNDREEIYGSVQLVNHDTKSKLPLHGRVVAVLTPVQHTLPEELVNKFQKRCTDLQTIQWEEQAS